MFRHVLFFLLFGALLFGGERRWEKSEWLWNLGIAQMADKGLSPKPKSFFKKDRFDVEAYRDIGDGDIVWIKAQFVKKFYEEVLPYVQHRFVLVISDGDEAFPSDSCLGKNMETFINHPMIAHIFAQNCDYRGSSDKVSHLPIGLDFHTLAYKKKHWWGERSSPSEQEHFLNELLTNLKPTHLRIKKAFVDFQNNNTNHSSEEDRTSIFKRLKTTGLIDYGPRMPRADLWKIKGKYAFSISPHGRGLDCHRTWEDLILGCIVIVKTSSLDPMYEGLPVVIVKDWSEVTEENLTQWLEQFKDALTNPSYREKLTNAYWLNKIRAAFRDP